jgi:hypothetical protein
MTSTRCLEREDLPAGEVRIKTRLTFSLRQPLGDELSPAPRFTHGFCVAMTPLRVAAQILDGFSGLNDNAERLFATPDQGLNR